MEPAITSSEVSVLSLGTESLSLPASPALRAKRVLDVVLALLLLLPALPVLVVAAVLVKLSSRGPVFFVQPRVGYQGGTFRMFKLRTMIDGADRLEDELRAAQSGGCFFKLADDPRTTAIGRWLRRSSIDELPQLWNVVRGDMSLVGPRPILLSDFRKFPPGRQVRRFAMLPGLTGLWQVSGRSESSDEERMQLDLEYVDGWSLRQDLAILLRTPAAVLRGRGAW